MSAVYTYSDRTLYDRGRPHAFLARVRSGPNLPEQSAVLSPHELDALGAQIAAALNQQQAARAMLAALRAIKDDLTTFNLWDWHTEDHPHHICSEDGGIGGACSMVDDAIAAAEAAGIIDA